MGVLQAFILGLVQGIAEFLPISSSGHLVLLYNIFGISDNVIFLSVVLHAATLLSVLVFYRKEVWALIRRPFQRKAIVIYIATIITVSVAVLFRQFFEDAFSGVWLPYAFLGTAVLLVISDIVSRTRKREDGEPKIRTGFVMGIMQSIAILPGISRSGATISGGLFSGESRETAVDLSFLMSIPIIIASLAMEIFKFMTGEVVMSSGLVLPLIVGSVVAFVVGFGAIYVTRKLIIGNKAWIFSIYLIGIAIITFFVI